LALAKTYTNALLLAEIAFGREGIVFFSFKVIDLLVDLW